MAADVRLYVSEQTGIAERVCALRPGCERIANIDRLPAGAVAVVTPGEAQQMLVSGASRGLVVWLKKGDALPPELARHSRVAAVLDAGCRDETVDAALGAATLLAAQDSRGAQAVRDLERILEIGRALAAEKDLDTLLALILQHARELTHADGASVYARERDGVLYFRHWQNASVANAAGRERHPVGERSIAGFVAQTGTVLVFEDAYAIPPDSPCQFNPSSDQATGYRTRSLLTVPLTNKNRDVVGVLQLINRKRDAHAVLANTADVEREVVPFDEHDRAIALALAGQAGVALENSMLYADIERLFEGFIRASVSAIEARDPTTAGHSFRVADIAERLAQAVDRSDAGELRELRFSREELRELRYAALLHDFGKVGVREDVLIKAKKLHPHQLDMVKQRFQYARLSIAWQSYRRLFDLFERDEIGSAEFRGRRAELEREIAAEHARLEKYLDTVLRANEPTILHASAPDQLREILSYRFSAEEGALPLLHEFEFSGLSLPKGSLSAEERLEIESHVTHTFSFLSLIPWTRDLARLPDFAYAHHEKLDGTGYPRGLRQRDIPVQSRMLTISDIYDALTAPDRPYKLAVPVERALAILESEAKAGKIDAQLLQVFVESGAWRAPA
jgi:HD-GYP domain-containing protein (c-di-GMP phosphodiesterase class II)